LSVVILIAACGRSGELVAWSDDGVADLATPVDASRPRDFAAGDMVGAPHEDMAQPPSGPTQAYNFRIDFAHTGSQPRETMTPPLTEAWSVDLGARANYALVARGRVFAAGGGGGPFNTAGSLIAVDAVTGATLWGPVALGSDLLIAYQEGLVFVAVSQTTLMALDEATGQMRWSTPMAYSDWSPPVAVDGLVYVNSYSGNYTAAYDQKTGALHWKNSISDGSPGSPALWNGYVVSSSGCDLTVALDGSTGAMRWRYYTGCTGGGGDMPTIWGGLVYVRDTPFGDDVILDLENGSVRGTFNSDTPLAFSGAQGYSLLGGTLRAFSTDTLATRWSFRGDGNLVTSPIVAGDYAYVASSTGMIYAVNGAGQLAWSADTGGAIAKDPEVLSLTVGEGTLLVPVGNRIVAYR
jgi:outer membrane protein assembly factor BamB